VFDRLATDVSFLSELVGRRRREQERLLTEEQGPAAIARFEAMFDARVSASSLPLPVTAVAVVADAPVPLLRRGAISTRRGKASPGMKVCPDCLETVLQTAPMCVYCRYDFERAVSAWPMTGMAAAS
jgi:hypothetical protein